MFRIEKVAQGVWAAVVIPGRGAVGNASIIDLGDCTVLVDTFNLPAAARLLRETAENLTEKPVKYIINTHYHGDHHYGNQEFQGSIILSTERTREVLTAHAAPDLEEWQKGLQQQITGLKEISNAATDSRLQQAIAYEISDKQALLEATPTIRRVTAAMTFKDSMDIHGSERSLHLFTYGGGHTLSDAMVYVADVQVLIAGDLVLNRFHPAMLHGFPEAWITIVERIGRESDFTRLIPGHGEVAGRESIPEMLRYLTEIQEYAVAAARSGESAEHWMAKGIPEPFDPWEGSHIFEWNFRWLFSTYTNF